MIYFKINRFSPWILQTVIHASRHTVQWLSTSRTCIHSCSALWKLNKRVVWVLGRHCQWSTCLTDVRTLNMIPRNHIKKSQVWWCTLIIPVQGILGAHLSGSLDYLMSSRLPRDRSRLLKQVYSWKLNLKLSSAYTPPHTHTCQHIYVNCDS